MTDLLCNVDTKTRYHAEIVVNLYDPTSGEGEWDTHETKQYRSISAARAWVGKQLRALSASETEERSYHGRVTGIEWETFEDDGYTWASWEESPDDEYDNAWWDHDAGRVRWESEG